MNNSETEGTDRSNQAPHDWNEALRVAAARLGEGYALPDTVAHPALAREIHYLAALLCAYGKLPEEADRLRARDNCQAAESRRAHPPAMIAAAISDAMLTAPILPDATHRRSEWATVV